MSEREPTPAPGSPATSASRPDEALDALTPEERLAKIAVVLVEPEGPRNVGSVARAMRNFGLSDLRIVKGVDPMHPEALEMGVRSHALLGSVRRTESLAEALDDRGFVIATTGRRRERVPALEPKAAAQRVLQELGRTSVALVFGREAHGLSAEELRQAHATIAIPTSPECRALNLSQALGVVAYEIFVASGAERLFAHDDPGRVLDGAARMRLREELQCALDELGLVHEGNEIACRQSLERLLSLGPMQSRDARLLFSMARRITGRASQGDGEAKRAAKAAALDDAPAAEGRHPSEEPLP